MVLVSDSASYAKELEVTLRGVSEGANVAVFLHEQAALDRIEKEQTALVFVRLSAGPLASCFFLNEVWKRNPKSARFVVDATLEAEAMVRCVLGGHFFLETPLTTSGLEAALERAATMRRFLRNERLQSLILRMRTLPPRPSICMEVLREARSPSASVSAVGDLVAKDLAVATRLMQLVNSPYYGVKEPITEVKQAVLVLGLDSTVAVVCAVETFARFDKVKPLYFSADRLWKHSQIVADLARKICLCMGAGQEMAAEAFLAGVLHDIGKLALAENFGEQYEAAIQIARSSGRTSSDVEMETFQATHSDAGAYLLTLWGLPLPVVESIAYHHVAPESVGSTFGPGVALHLAENILESSGPVDDIIERYPPELGLWDCLDELGRLISEDAGFVNSARVAEVHKPNSPRSVPSRLSKLFAWR